ncbi:DegT/DnrJ/EryC1/StrS family aminotransferase [Halorutilales archaeon Cl-col2-1]
MTDELEVPFFPLRREMDDHRNEILSKIEETLQNGDFILGNEVSTFESEFAEYLGVEHGIGVGSGSDALYLALRALGIGSGDEVITVSHTFVSTADAIVRNGATPVFVDIDPGTYTIDPTKLEASISPNTKAILPVHLYGHPAPMDDIRAIADEHDLTIVEDASQAHGAMYDDSFVGSLGDIACFSLYPTKNLGAYGDAGIVVTDDDELADRVGKLREYGTSGKYRYEEVGVNSRLDELQAAILREKLGYLDDYNDRRRAIARQYTESLSGVETPVEHNDSKHVYYLYVIQTPNREELQRHLDERGIGTQIHYPIPVHQQQSYSDIGTHGDLAVTERVTDRILSLPMHPWMQDDEVQAVIDSIGEYAN